MRQVARDAGTSTRAVYTLFGSRDGLVAALAAHGFNLLGAAVRALPMSDDVVADLVAAGLAFREFALEHPTLFAVAVQHAAPNTRQREQVRAASDQALMGLLDRLHRLADTHGLGGRTVHGAALQFHALCEGLAAFELRCPDLGDPDPGSGQQIWEQALTALLTGFAGSAAKASRS